MHMRLAYLPLFIKYTSQNKNKLYQVYGIFKGKITLMMIFDEMLWKFKP